MGVVQKKLSKTSQNFFDSEKSSGILLIICTIISLVITNSILGVDYVSLWQMYIAGLTFHFYLFTFNSLCLQCLCGKII